MSGKNRRTSEEVDALLEWIGLAYEGPLEDVPWRSFLDFSRTLFRAEAVTLILRRPVDGDRGLILGSGGRGHRWESAYAEKFFAIDPFLQLPPGRVVTIDEIISFEDYEQTDYYHQFMRPTGNYFVIGVDTELEPGVVLRFRLSRPFEAGNFGPEEKSLCERIVPHLKRSMRFLERVEQTVSQRELYADAVDHMAVAAILLDENCRILEASRTAAALLERSDVLQVRDGCLSVVDPREARVFRRVVDEALLAREAGGPTIVKTLGVGRNSGREHLGLVVRTCETRLPAWTDKSGAIEIFVRSPSVRASASADAIRDLFGLTAAEAALAARVADGERLIDAASSLGISRHTARNQLAAVFSKVGVSRQAELVRLILESVEALARATAPR